MSTCGAAMSTSCPVVTMDAARAWSPGASTPSSLVTRMRTRLRAFPVRQLFDGTANRLTRRASVLGEPAGAEIANALADVHGVIADPLVEAADQRELHRDLQ